VAVAETATHRRLRTFGLRRAVLLGSAAVLVMVGLAPASAAPARSAQPF
jgi:hypothetical protein